jgi:hypothetical protein
LTELAGIRSLADEMAWVTSHKFRNPSAAKALDDALRSIHEDDRQGPESPAN